MHRILYRLLTKNGRALDVLTDRLHRAASLEAGAWDEEPELKSVTYKFIFQTTSSC